MSSSPGSTGSANKKRGAAKRVAVLDDALCALTPFCLPNLSRFARPLGGA